MGPRAQIVTCRSFISKVVSARGPGLSRLTGTDQRQHSVQVRRMKKSQVEETRPV